MNLKFQLQMTTSNNSQKSNNSNQRLDVPTCQYRKIGVIHVLIVSTTELLKQLPLFFSAKLILIGPIIEPKAFVSTFLKEESTVGRIPS